MIYASEFYRAVTPAVARLTGSPYAVGGQKQICLANFHLLNLFPNIAKHRLKAKGPRNHDSLTINYRAGINPQTLKPGQTLPLL